MRMRKILAAMGLASISLLALSGCSANAEYEINRYENLNGIDHILIDATSSNVTIAPSTDGTISVECKNMEKMKYYVGVEGDTLVVKYNPKWHQWLFSGALFRNDETSATIYLPEGEYRQLTVDMTSGSFVVPEGYTFGTADVEVTSGSLKFGADVINELDVECTSGDMEFVGVNCARFEVELTSGELTLLDVNCSVLDAEATSGSIDITNLAAIGGLAVEVTSGEIDLSNVTVANVFLKATSGEISASDLIVAGLMQIEMTSGDADLERCDAGSMEIEVTSGSVRGTLLTPKNFSVRQGSGRVDVPHDGNGGPCKINVTSGRVQLSIIE